MRLMHKNDPKRIVEQILSGKPLQFVTEYKNTLLDFKLIKILLNDEVICEETGSK